MKHSKRAEIRTREYGWHQSGEHEKEQAEEETTGVVVRLLRVIANVQVQQTDENSRCQMRSQTQPSQRLTRHKNNKQEQ